ncbi:MAG: molybdenum cofactor biosynthesis protein MoaE [Pirellulaceae bacterium]
MNRIVTEPLDINLVRSQVSQPECGAVLIFEGTTRQFTHGRETVFLEYESYESMAERAIEQLEQEAIQRFGLVACRMMHRIGRVEIGETSVVIGIGSRHRAEAIVAIDWILNELKRSIPIWKCEHWSDGTSEWQHPVDDNAQPESTFGANR